MEATRLIDFWGERRSFPDKNNSYQVRWWVGVVGEEDGFKTLDESVGNARHILCWLAWAGSAIERSN